MTSDYEPVSPVELYYYLASNRTFEEQELRREFSNIKDSLDNVCNNELKTEEYDCAEFGISLTKRSHNEDISQTLHESIDLNAREKRGGLISDLQERYNNMFTEHARDHEPQQKTTIETYLIGYRDKITHDSQIEDHPYE